MRLACLLGLALCAMVFAARSLVAEDYLKDHELTQPLKIVQLQGGFAGFTGTQYSIGRDGAWTRESIFREKLTPQNKGKLSAEDLAKLAGILDKYELGKLPEKSGEQPGANPHTITLEYGKKKASWVGRTPPKVERENPARTVENRFAGILEGVVGLLTPLGGKERR